MLTKILYIFLALIILMVLITVHEFGHYIAGKIFKFKINEFSIGFGKAIYKKNKKNGEVFSIRILPLGGYCAFEGEDEEHPGKDAFNSRPAWQRLIVLFSGVLFNFVFGILTSAIYLMVAGYSVPVVASVRNYAIEQGLNLGDKIVAVNGKTVEAYRPITDLFADYSACETLNLTVERNGKQFSLNIKKEKTTEGYYYVSNALNVMELYVKDNSAEGTYKPVDINEFRQTIINSPITVQEDDTKLPSIETIYYRKTDSGEYEQYSLAQMKKDGVISYVDAGTSIGVAYFQTTAKYSFFESLGKAWPFAFYICGLILGALGGLFTGATHISDMGGTITTIATIAEYSAINPIIILYLFPMLSLNLAIFNILPIPALDGARMCFVGWEMLTKKPVSRKVEGWVHTIGLFALLALVIFLDIYHFVV